MSPLSQQAKTIHVSQGPLPNSVSSSAVSARAPPRLSGKHLAESLRWFGSYYFGTWSSSLVRSSRCPPLLFTAGFQGDK